MGSYCQAVTTSNTISSEIIQEGVNV